MKRKVFVILTAVLIIISLSISAFAHSGKTDGNGGHKDNKNISGLGSYHYHCEGSPAHLHENGVCPYSRVASSSSRSNKSKVVTVTPSTKKDTPKKAKAEVSSKNSIAAALVGIALPGTAGTFYYYKRKKNKSKEQ